MRKLSRRLGFDYGAGGGNFIGVGVVGAGDSTGVGWDGEGDVVGEIVSATSGAMLCIGDWDGCGGVVGPGVARAVGRMGTRLF